RPHLLLCGGRIRPFQPNFGATNTTFLTQIEAFKATSLTIGPKRAAAHHLVVLRAAEPRRGAPAAPATTTAEPAFLEWGAAVPGMGPQPPQWTCRDFSRAASSHHGVQIERNHALQQGTDSF